jgi:peptide-methionine (S)-S-oxide reductase
VNTLLKLKKNVRLLLLASLSCFSCSNAAVADHSVPDDMIINDTDTTAVATFGTGCFWCTEAQFQLLEGVLTVVSGYSGGEARTANYEKVSMGTTGHAEVVQITYNPNQITYAELLQAFWKAHDPTTLNRQGNDVGPQYRSVIFYHDPKQREEANYYKQKLTDAGVYDNPIVTEISPFEAFYPAEKYHQNYYNQNGNQSYCVYVIQPKLAKFKEVFKDKLKKEAR